MISARTSAPQLIEARREIDSLKHDLKDHDANAWRARARAEARAAEQQAAAVVAARREAEGARRREHAMAARLIDASLGLRSKGIGVGGRPPGRGGQTTHSPGRIDQLAKQVELVSPSRRIGEVLVRRPAEAAPTSHLS